MKLSVGMFLFSLFVFAQQGKVVNNEKQPIEGATVLLKKDNVIQFTTNTNYQGRFYFTKEQVQESKVLIVSILGYQIFEKPIENTLNFGEIILQKSEKEIESIVVKSTKSTIKSNLDKTTFDTKNFVNAQGGTGVDVLKNIPSISVDAQGSVMYRGSSGFALYLNGKPLQIDPVAFLQQMPANAIEKIEILTTPSAKFDSEGKAGIINVITKKTNQNQELFQVNAKYGLPSIEDYDNVKNDPKRYGADLVYAFQKKKWDFTFGVNYNRNDLSGRRVGDVYTIINNKFTRFPSDGERSMKEINYSGRATIGFAPDSLNTFNLGIYLGKQTKERVADIVYNNYAYDVNNPNANLYNLSYFNENLLIRKGDFAISSFDYQHLFRDQSKIIISALYEHTMLGGPITNKNLGYPNTSLVYQDEYNTNSNPLNGFRFQTDYTFIPLEIGQVEVGYQYKLLDHRGDFLYERRDLTTGNFEILPEFSSEVNLYRHSHSIYGQLIKTKEKWNYSIGLRTEILDRDFELKDKSGFVNETYEYEYFKLFPSASVQYIFSNSNKIKLGYSKRVEHTTTFKMNPFPEREHSETLEQGDAKLLPEFIDLAELNYTSKIKGKHTFFTTIYFRNIENLINRVNTVYNDTILNRIYSNVGNARTIGLESGGELKWAKFSLFGSGNVFHTQIKGSFNNEIVNQKSWMFSGNMNVNYQFYKTFSSQFTFNYLSQRITAQGKDSEFYLPSLAFRKTFLSNQLIATVQWQNIDMGILKTNEQRITTHKPNSFYTTTNYIHEVDMIVFQLNYTFNPKSKKAKFTDSEFGKKEF